VTRRQVTVAAVFAAGFVALAALPFVLPGFYVSLASRILIVALFALAFNVVFGMGGMPSLGHAAFFGLAGYTVGLGVVRWDWGFATIVVVALTLGAAMGALFGVLTQRSKGIYLLLLTLALGQAVWGLAFQQVALTRGDNGISGVARDVIPLGPLNYYHFVLAVTVSAAVLLWAFTRSAVGRTIVGCRESPTRMAALGYPVGTYRIVAFVVSGTFSALAGVLYAWHFRFVSPDMLAWETSALVLVVAVLGGARTFAGPAVGAAVIIGLEFWVSLYTDRWMTVLGLVYIVVILFLPDGILGLGERLRRRDRRHEREPVPGKVAR
jgi:branched-chain amino acid transport system permease protein